jgi:hypothetical protein
VRGGDRRHRPRRGAHRPLEAAEIEVIRPTAKQRAAADGGFYDAVAEAGLRYVPRPALDAAVAGAATRPSATPGHGPARAYRSISRHWSLCPWPRWGHATRAYLHNREPAIYI